MTRFRPDILELQEFYNSHLGMMACRILRREIEAFWPEKHESSIQQILGVGFAAPYMRGLWEGGRHRLAALMPAGQGVIQWPKNSSENSSFLAHETELPFRDETIDKALLVHALEFTDPEFFLPELWRVLAPGGQALFIVPRRGGAWSHAEHTPFGHGRPYSTAQLQSLLKNAFFTVQQTRTALCAPPITKRTFIKLAEPIEHAKNTLKLPLGGTICLLVEKCLHAPTSGNRAPAFAGLSPKLAPSIN